MFPNVRRSTGDVILSRSLAREIAMKMLYSDLLNGNSTYMSVCEQMGIGGKAADPGSEDRADGSAFDSFLSEDDVRYCEQIVHGVTDNAQYLDSIIGEHSCGWSVDRISRVDLCILRLCVYELCFMPGIPHSASINAAVELAKTFGGEKSYSFINGILGSIERDHSKADDDSGND